MSIIIILQNIGTHIIGKRTIFWFSSVLLLLGLRHRTNRIRLSRITDKFNMTSKKVATNSTENLLRLFKVQPTHHVITRQDLVMDYDVDTMTSENSKIDDDNANTTLGQVESTETIAINNYYTWNSHRTNKSFHKYVGMGG